ncbi:hypothetical protein KCP69_24265 [Salmonella enterica subsp. enterica]|nr:hypothetical protein KCP69_24265 [Salmonella enterica subsp. enterica]
MERSARDLLRPQYFGGLIHAAAPDGAVTPCTSVSSAKARPSSSTVLTAADYDVGITSLKRSSGTTLKKSECAPMPAVRQR